MLIVVRIIIQYPQWHFKVVVKLSWYKHISLDPTYT